MLHPIIIGVGLHLELNMIHTKYMKTALDDALHRVSLLSVLRLKPQLLKIYINKLAAIVNTFLGCFFGQID